MSNDKIKARIQALLKKTTENGASEAEALSAAEKARELMDKYNVTVTIDETKEDGIVQSEVTATGKKRDQVLPMAVGIADFCDCTVFTRDGIHVVFVGTPSDAEMATAMYIMLRSTRDHDWKAFKKSQNYHNAVAEAGGNPNVVYRTFSLAFGIRIAERLRELAVKRKVDQEHIANSAPGRALVVVKDEMIKSYMNSQVGPLRRDRGGRLRKGSSTARTAGRMAGDRAHLQRRTK